MFAASEHVQRRSGRSLVASVLIHIAAVIAIVSAPLFVDGPRLELNLSTATKIVFPLRAPVSIPLAERPSAPRIERMRQPLSLPEMPAERAALVRTPQPRIEPRRIESQRPEAPTPLLVSPDIRAPAKPLGLEQVRPAAPPEQEEPQVEIGGFGRSSAAVRTPSEVAAAGAADSFRSVKPDRQGGRRRAASYQRSGFGAAARRDERSPKDVAGAGKVEAGSSFGSATASSPAGAVAGQVQNAGFGQVVAGEQRIEAERAVERASTTSAARVLAKPMPQYTDEARRLRIEGDVRLRVNFRADATVEVLEVIEGLGHGLDESAVRAARQIEFAPAEQGGKPVDFIADVFIRFRLAY